MLLTLAVLATFVGATVCLANDTKITPPSWIETFGPTTRELSFTGPVSFSHLPYTRCLEDPSAAFDIAILGFPFDTTTSYRPGARFGPHGIRLGSRRQHATYGSFTTFLGFDPYKQGKTVLDCGDIPISQVHNGLALKQMEVAYGDLLGRNILDQAPESRRRRTSLLTKSGVEIPRIVSLGGDHTIVLPILRALGPHYGPISVIHFDSHPDTGATKPVDPPYDGSDISHGSYFTIAHREGLLTNTSVHVGIRQKMNTEFIDHDKEVGFDLIAAEDIDDIGVNGIVERVRERVGTGPVYLTVDIDVLDPAFAPATGTPEAGGFTVRELKRILRGLNGLNIIGVDLVEVAPIYDVSADTTSIISADIVNDFIALLVGKPAPGESLVAQTPRPEEYAQWQQATFSM